MSQITISDVSFTAPLVSDIYVTFRYRKQGDPLWIIIAANYLVPMSGVLTPPIVITGLDPITTYEVSAVTQNCPTEEFITTLDTPTATCPVIYDIGLATSSN